MRWSDKRLWRGLAVLAFLATAGGCARTPAVDSHPAPGGGPVVTRLDPTSGPAGEDYPIDLTIYGSGFDAAGNVVTFGSISIPDLPSTDGGTRIALAVPKTAPATGEVAPLVLMPGTYPVAVTTSRGTSEPVPFRLTRALETDTHS